MIAVAEIVADISDDQSRNPVDLSERHVLPIAISSAVDMATLRCTVPAASIIQIVAVDPLSAAIQKRSGN